MASDSYVLMLQAAPDDYQVGMRALQRAHQLVREGATIKQVFFYGPGVIYANSFLQFPSGYSNLQEHWRSFATEFSVPLVMCATVGTQYGVEAEPPPMGNLAEGFLAGGLAEFIEVLASSEHLLQFEGTNTC